MEKDLGHEGAMEQFNSKQKELEDLLEKDQIWWAQRSRASWLKRGDRNTKFFHQKASQRRKRNWIHQIKNDAGEVFFEEEKIARVMTEFFQ